MKKSFLPVAVGAAAILAAALWWRKHPSACPYGQRWSVAVPHPLITRSRLKDALRPIAGERLLEIGPGTGYYSLDAAEWVGPEGSLDVFDIQQQMLDHTMNRAAGRGIENISPTQGDAQRLPYDPEDFDGAFLVTTLGEIPDQAAAILELARVVRPGGRIVVGELMGDPHWVSPGAIRDHAEGAGLRVERRVGPWFGSFTVLRKPG
jgi:ubiquinone/menaquinone biosynthesis C-methylase UbiE